MDGYEALVAVIAIMMPVFLVAAFRSRRRDSSTSPADQQHIVMLSEAARKMERRIESLEMLLDTEVPGWRSRSGVR
jgi:phage shock protein B